MSSSPEHQLNVPTKDQVSQWMDHDKKLLEEGADINQFGGFVISAAQYDELWKEESERHAVSPEQTDAPQSEQAVDAKSETMNPERLKEIAGQHIFTISTHIDNKGRTFRHMPENLYEKSGKKLVSAQLNVLSALDETSSFGVRGDFGREKVMAESKALNKMGVAEMVTLVSAEDYLGPKLPMFNEPQMQGKYFVLEYRTAADSGYGPYSFKDSGARPGDYLYYNILIAGKEVASELATSIQNNPDIVRQLADTMMTESSHLNDERGFDMGSTHSYSQESWAGEKPPYEDWKAANNGVNRIAFRTSVNQPVEQTQVLEFS